MLGRVQACGVGAVEEPASPAGVRLVGVPPAPVEVRAFADEHAYRAWLEAFRDEPLLYDGSPLCRAAVATVGGDGVVVLRAHHGVLDGYGLTTVFRRIADRYAGAAADDGPVGDVEALRGAAPSGPDPDPAFWARALDGIADPGREIAFTDRVAEPTAAPLRYAARVDGHALRARRSWPAEAAATVGAYVAGHLGTDDAVIGVVAALRRSAAERSTPVQWMAVIPSRIRVSGSGPAEAGAALTRWLDAAATRVRRGERPEQLRAVVPAAWRTGRTHGPIVNVLAFVGDPPWSLEVSAWGPIEDCLVTVLPADAGGLIVDGVFHPDLYDGATARAHVEGIAALLAAALPDPALPFSAHPVAARPADPDRVPVPGGFVVPARIREALAAAGLGDAEIRTGPALTVVLAGADEAALARARAVLPAGVRLRRS